MPRYTYTVDITVVAETEGQAYKTVVETINDDTDAEEVIIQDDPDVEEDDLCP